MSWDNGAGMDIVDCVADNAVRLQIEARARTDAETGAYNPPTNHSGTYWDQVVQAGERAVYHQAYEKRRLRLERMKERAA